MTQKMEIACFEVILFISMFFDAYIYILICLIPLPLLQHDVVGYCCLEVSR